MERRESETTRLTSRMSRLSSKPSRRGSEPNTGENSKPWNRSSSALRRSASNAGRKIDGRTLSQNSLGDTGKLASRRGSKKSVAALTADQSRQSRRHPESKHGSTMKNVAKATTKKEIGEGAATTPRKLPPATSSASKAAPTVKAVPSKSGSSRRKPSAWDTWKYPAYGFAGGVIFLVLTILLYRVMFPYPVVPTKFYSICETGGCAEFSRLIRSSINTALDPCENFYRFVCSTWDSKHNVSMQQAHRDEYVASLAATARAVVAPAEGKPQNLRQKVALLYQSCEAVAHRRRDDTGQFRNLLAQGGLTWPEGRPTSNEDSPSFHGVLVYSHFQVGFDPVFTVDLADNSTVAVQPSDVVSDWIHTRGEWKAVDAYHDKLRRVCRHFSGLRSTCSGSELTAFAEADEGLSKALTVLFREDDRPPLNRSQFENASSARPFDDWARFFSKMLNVTLERVRAPDTAFDLRNPAFFRALNVALTRFRDETFVLYLAWITIFHLGPLFSAELSDAIAESTTSSSAGRVVETRCLAFMEKLLGQAMPAAFVQLNVAEEAQEDIRRITKNIDYPLNITLTKFTSNGSEGNHDFSKFTTRPHLFGDNGHFPSVVELEEAASDALPEMGDSVLTNYRRTMAFRRTMRIGGCYAPKLDRHNYYRFYDRGCRTVVVSPIAATLPIYDEQTSSGLRYGAIGSLVAEALFEAFYETRERLKPVQREKLNSARTCIERSIFKVDTVENMEEAFLLYGGNAALWSAYRSEVYLQDRRLPGLEEYSEDMLFFISFCFIHCGGSAMPRDTLCNIPLKSSPYFADAFTCTLGSAMNLGNRCSYI